MKQDKNIFSVDKLEERSNPLLDRLKKSRNDIGLSFRTVASKLKENGVNVSDVTVSNWEQGKTDISVVALKELAKIYHVSATWLVTGLGKIRVEDIPLNLSDSPRSDEKLTPALKSIIEERIIYSLSDEEISMLKKLNFPFEPSKRLYLLVLKDYREIYGGEESIKPSAP